MVILFLPCFNLFFPLRYKKVFKVEIPDSYISAVVMSFLPFPSKTFCKLLSVPWRIRNPLLSAREESREQFFMILDMGISRSPQSSWSGVLGVSCL